MAETESAAATASAFVAAAVPAAVPAPARVAAAPLSAVMRSLAQVAPSPAPMPVPAPVKGKTRRGSETRRMALVKPIRFTDSELSDAEGEAKAAGLALEDYLRDTASTEPEARGGEVHVTRRAHVKYLRLTPEQHEKIEALADRAGLTYGSYVRARALKKPVTLTTRRPPVEKAELARLLGLLGNVASNINQVARQLNSGADVPLLAAEAAMAEVQAAAAEIIRTLGREPAARTRR